LFIGSCQRRGGGDHKPSMHPQIAGSLRPDEFEGDGYLWEDCAMEQVFRQAYQRNIWGDPESVSGPGSGVARTASFRDQIPRLLNELGANSLLDAGCGDFNWMKEVSLPVEQYVGIDVVPELIAHNGQRYNEATRRFMHGDILRAELPRVDVILCRDCLVHFSFEDVWTALRNFKRSGSSYVLATTFTEFSDNVDIETGGWRRLNLEQAPFNFPPPEKSIDEKCPHPGGEDKRLALWRLKDIPVKIRITDYLRRIVRSN
jgi:SAM-dependent methyltransferase